MDDRQSTIARELKRVLVEALDLDVAPEDIGDDDPLFEAGLGVDSVEALILVRAVERRFGVEVPDDEIGIGMFQDIRALSEVVTRLGGAAA